MQAMMKLDANTQDDHMYKKTMDERKRMRSLTLSLLFGFLLPTLHHQSKLLVCLFILTPLNVLALLPLAKFVVFHKTVSSSKSEKVHVAPLLFYAQIYPIIVESIDRKVKVMDTNCILCYATNLIFRSNFGRP